MGTEYTREEFTTTSVDRLGQGLWILLGAGDYSFGMLRDILARSTLGSAGAGVLALAATRRHTHGGDYQELVWEYAGPRGAHLEGRSCKVHFCVVVICGSLRVHAPGVPWRAWAEMQVTYMLMLWQRPTRQDSRYD